MTNDLGAIPDGAAADVYDSAILADLADLFGKERLVQLLGGLDDEIARRLGTAAPDFGGLDAHAHALVSVSGTLGFSALSQACMALEQACLDGGDVAGALRTAQAEAARARRAIVRLHSGDV